MRKGTSTKEGKEGKRDGEEEEICDNNEGKLEKMGPSSYSG